MNSFTALLCFDVILLSIFILLAFSFREKLLIRVLFLLKVTAIFLFLVLRIDFLLSLYASSIFLEVLLLVYALNLDLESNTS